MSWIKICGVMTPADAVFAAECGADAVGLNFYPGSRRFVTEEQAEAIVHELPASVVGVFVDHSNAGMSRLVSRLSLHAVQSYRDAFRDAHAGYIAAFRVADEQALRQIRESVAAVGDGRTPDAVLLDSHVPGEMGGTGHRAPWELIAAGRLGVPVILAGGLTPDNVAEAIRTVRPAGVDVASGVESAPGKKDPGKVRAFIQAAREAAAALPGPPPVFRLRARPAHLE
jgi:phosphoribosylanthranilate isomerase